MKVFFKAECVVNIETTLDFDDTYYNRIMMKYACLQNYYESMFRNSYDSNHSDLVKMINEKVHNGGLSLNKVGRVQKIELIESEDEFKNLKVGEWFKLLPDQAGYDYIADHNSVFMKIDVCGNINTTVVKGEDVGKFRYFNPNIVVIRIRE